MTSAKEDSPIWVLLWPSQGRSPYGDEKYLAYARVYAQASGKEELRTLLSRQPVVARGEKGKPYFPDIWNVHFSLSHSGKYNACAFYEQPVGLDLQEHISCNREAIARRFFHPDEYSYLKRNGFAPFFQIWTAKESYVKQSGDGLSGMMKEFSVVDAGGLRQELNGVYFAYQSLPDAFSMCICACTIPDIRMKILEEPPS